MNFSSVFSGCILHLYNSQVPCMLCYVRSRMKESQQKEKLSFYINPSMVLSHCGRQLFLSAIWHQDNTANKMTGSRTMIPAMLFTWDPSAAQPLHNPGGFWCSARWGVHAAEYRGHTCWFTTHCCFYGVQLAPRHAFAEGCTNNILKMRSLKHNQQSHNLWIREYFCAG